MTKLETKIANELVFTKVGETNDQKAKRIAESVKLILEEAYDAQPDSLDFEEWLKKENLA